MPEVEVGFGWLDRSGGGGGVVSGSQRCVCVLTCEHSLPQVGRRGQHGRRCDRQRKRAFGGCDSRTGRRQGSLGKEHGASNAASWLPRRHFPPMSRRRPYKPPVRGPRTCGTCGVLGVSASRPACVLSSMAGLEEGEWKGQRSGGRT